MLPDLYQLAAGQRIAIVGQTGSGKTTLAQRYMRRSRYHWIIFNPKLTPAYNRLSPRITLSSKITPELVAKTARKTKYTILNFPRGWSWEYQDALLSDICEELINIGICIDELYKMHASNGHAGEGLNGLITRGRELKQSLIGLTQRPKFVSQFIFSESDYLIEFRLSLPGDRKVLYEHTGDRLALEKQAGHNFMFFDLASDKAIEYHSR